jgi:glutamate-ammonia-ligase adenylyltransferase
MAEILIRDPGLLHWIADPDVLDRRRDAADIASDLAGQLLPLHADEHRADMLRIVKRREILHVGVRDILRRVSVDVTLAALSRLADTLLAAACSCAARTVEGSATTRDLEILLAQPEGFAVIALGKLGAEELNFSSDVDLIYVSDGNQPQTRVESLAKAMTALLAAQTREGHVYRVDLRLRPEGRAGALVAPLPTLSEYYATRGATWERLALLRARPVAGDAALGHAFLAAVDSFVFGRGLDADALADIRRMKAEIDARVRARTDKTADVKLGPGGIREIELIAQTLQIGHAHRHPALRQRSTIGAINALIAQGLLSAEGGETLVRAYRFLRDLENRLQMVHDVQQHTLPRDGQALARLARSLGYAESSERGAAAQAFMADYEHHTGCVHRLLRETLEDDTSP